MTYPDPDGNSIIPLPPELDLDKNGLGVIEEGIKQLVAILKKLGYKTVCSCAGHTGGLEPYPWIVFLMESEQEEKLFLKLMVALGRFNKNQGKNGSMPMSKDTWVVSSIQHDPEEDMSVTLYLHPADLNPCKNPRRISALRKQSEKLADFLENQCVDLYK